MPSKANAGHLPHGKGPHPVLSVQTEGNISGQEPQSPFHLPLAPGRQSKHSDGRGAVGSKCLQEQTLRVSPSLNLCGPVAFAQVACPRQPQAGTYPNWEPAPTVL